MIFQHLDHFIMMEIHYPGSATELSEIKRLLEDYSFAHKLVYDGSLKEIQLLEGRNTILGKDKVLKHIRKLVEETGQWWYCQCP